MNAKEHADTIRKALHPEPGLVGTATHVLSVVTDAVLFLLERAALESTPGESKPKAGDQFRSTTSGKVYIVRNGGWLQDSRGYAHPQGDTIHDIPCLLKSGELVKVEQVEPVASESGAYEHPREAPDDAAAKFIRPVLTGCGIYVGEKWRLLPTGSKSNQSHWTNELRSELRAVIAAERFDAVKGYVEAFEKELAEKDATIAKLEADLAALLPHQKELEHTRERVIEISKQRDELQGRLRNLRDLYSIAAATPAIDTVRFGKESKESNVSTH